MIARSPFECVPTCSAHMRAWPRSGAALIPPSPAKSTDKELEAAQLQRDATCRQLAGVYTVLGVMFILAAWALRSQSSAAGTVLLAKGQGSSPPLAAPLFASWTNSVAICAVVRADNTTDLGQWVEYHRWLGVDQVILTDVDGRHRAELQHFVRDGFVTYLTADGAASHSQVYADCIRRHSHNVNWLAFIDTNEFIQVRDRDVNLKEFLDEYKDTAGLAVSWVVHGTGARRPALTGNGSLREGARCSAAPHSSFKVIANSRYVLAPSSHPYNFWFRGHSSPVTEAREPVGLKCSGQPRPRVGRHATSQACQLVPAAKIEDPKRRSAQRIALAHYLTQPTEERWQGAQASDSGARGSIAGKHPDAICNELAATADECCPQPDTRASPQRDHS